MSRLGRIHFREQNAPAFLPSSSWSEDEHAYSEQTAREIDAEVASIIKNATAEVRSVLEVRRAALEAVAQRLIEKEVIDGPELRQILAEHNPGPKLVPASVAVEPRSHHEDDGAEPTIQEPALRVEER